MSKLEVDAIEPQSGTTLTLGASGDSVNIASGATITDFTSTGIDDNATSTAITIDSNEQVGIGTTSLQPFLVNGARGSGMGSYPTWETTTGRNLALFETDQSEGTFVLGSPTNGYAQLGFADPSHKSSGRIGYDHSADAMVFGTNSGTERMRITSAGDFLVGKTSTSVTTAGDELRADGEAVFVRAGGHCLRLQRLTNEGNVAVFYNNVGTNTGSISVGGSSTAYNTSSDYRLKENVNYDFDATTRLKQLKPARFNFIADADTTVDGFLAHEVSSVVPEAISGEKDAVDKNGKPVYQGIDQSKLVPLLVKTIQELETRITALENNQP